MKKRPLLSALLTWTKVRNPDTWVELADELLDEGSDAKAVAELLVDLAHQGLTAAPLPPSLAWLRFVFPLVDDEVIEPALVRLLEKVDEKGERLELLEDLVDRLDDGDNGESRPHRAFDLVEKHRNLARPF